MPSIDADRAGLRGSWVISLTSVGWTLASGCGFVALGLCQGSVLLAAFGAVGLVDAAGSAVLAHHFRQGLRERGLSDQGEELAHRVVSLGLITVGAAAVVFATIRLRVLDESSSSSVEAVFAGVSMVVLLILSWAKRALARRVASPALRRDADLSAVGAAEALLSSLGVLARRVGSGWVDPAAAIVVGVAATAIGVRGWSPRRRPRPERTAATVQVGVPGSLVGDQFDDPREHHGPPLRCTPQLRTRRGPAESP